MKESEIRAIVRDEISKILAPIARINQQTYLPTSEAYKLLGYRSARQLYNAVEHGLLRLGREVQDRRTNTSEKPRYYFNISVCLKRLEQLPENRSN